jgi:hypothetical protein
MRAVSVAALVLTGCVCGDPGAADGGDSGTPQFDGGPCVPPVSTDSCLRGVCDLDGTPRLAPVDDGTAAATQVSGDC